MTKKVYKSAQGKVVDLGALMLQNENVRAVGNMNVNARGDVLDSNNQIIETTSQRVQKSYLRQTNVTKSSQVVSSTREAKNLTADESTSQANFKVSDNKINEEPAQVDLDQLNADQKPMSAPSGGLAAAIARAKTVKQELEPTLRERIKQTQPKPKI